MKCPKCNVRIQFGAVHMEFSCHKCGTPLTSNAFLVSTAATGIALFANFYIKRSYCTSPISVTASPLPSFCSDWILIPVAIVIGLLILFLFIRINGPKSEIMPTLKDTLKTKGHLALVVAVLLGIAMSFLHDAVQLLLLPLGEWGRVTFIVGAKQPFIAEVLVNISFQVLTFGLSSVAILWALAKLQDVRTMKYPLVLFLANLVLGLWWVPHGLVFGFKPEILSALPLLPFSVLAAALVYFALAHALVRKRGIIK